jgi:Na+/proline symporter
MNINTFSLIFAVIAVIYSLISGIRGIINRKVINNLASLILSISQVVCAIILIIGIIALVWMGKVKI